MKIDEERAVRVMVDQVQLEGNLGIPENAKGIVLFAHGSGSSRLSPRNRYVARRLRMAGLATLLIDLLTMEEEAAEARTGHLRFDISMLAHRLGDATEWLKSNPDTKDLNIGYFGASTGAGAALVAAVSRPDDIKAIVSRGGRADLAGPLLAQVKAPTLLIVGGADYAVMALNKEAFAKLKVMRDMKVIPGATHLFEEPGALEEVGRLAADWFVKYLAKKPPAG